MAETKQCQVISLITILFRHAVFIRFFSLCGVSLKTLDILFCCHADILEQILQSVSGKNYNSKLMLFKWTKNWGSLTNCDPYTKVKYTNYE